MGSARKPRTLRATTPERPVFDDRKGQVDIWPILAADPVELAEEIERGDHDGYLFDLLHGDRSQYQSRPAVQDAIRRRRGE